jgi:hypothetical protein
MADLPPQGGRFSFAEWPLENAPVAAHLRKMHFEAAGKNSRKE